MESISWITGKVNARRSIDIGKAFEALGSEQRTVLLEFHVFTGCDQTSNSKLTCWKVFNDSQSDIISAFKDLASEISIDSAVAPFARFVMKLFPSNTKVASDETLAIADGHCIQNSKIVTSYHQHL